MPDYGHELAFGTFITPQSRRPGEVLALAQLTERVGFDLVSFQDHPYQPAFLDAWTLLSWVAAQTQTLTVAPNLLSLPLRQPTVVARAAASLDLLSGGRVELGLGTGTFWDGIGSMGGRLQRNQRRVSPGAAGTVDRAAAGAGARARVKHVHPRQRRPAGHPALRRTGRAGATRGGQPGTAGGRQSDRGGARPKSTGPLPQGIDYGRLNHRWDKDVAPQLKGPCLSFETDQRPERPKEPSPASTHPVAALKERYDPDDLFKQNFPIPPAADVSRQQAATVDDRL
jgi:hypothetical protein